MITLSFYNPSIYASLIDFLSNASRLAKKLVHFTLCSLVLSLVFLPLPESGAEPMRWRATWWSDPSSTVALGWDQPEDGKAELEFYERESPGAKISRITVNPPEKGHSYWSQLTNLKPDTAYTFRVVTYDQGKRLVSRELWFKTMPDQPKRLTVIAGGDSRNNRQIRRMANLTVAQLNVDFVLFGGDFTSSDSKKQWRRWFDDWQLSISSSGRLTPLVPARGNHDSEKRLGRAWGRAHPHFYSSLSFAGDLLRVYTLNSERAAGGEQHRWLEQELQRGMSARLRWVQYHKPMRPHVRLKKEGEDEYAQWAPLFARYSVDLAIECDSHMMKVTYPLWPSRQGYDGFKRVTQGTTFIGEGGWGAPLRMVDDKKPWTMMSGRFNHFFYIEVEPSGVYRLTPIGLNIVGEQLKTDWKSSPAVPTALTHMSEGVPLGFSGVVQGKSGRMGIGYDPLILNPTKVPSTKPTATGERGTSSEQ